MSALLADVRCACPLCERSFPNEAALVEHCGGLLPEPDDEPFFCSCGAFFCSPQSLAGHCDATGHAPEGAEAFGDEYGDASDGEEVEIGEDGSCLCPMCGAEFTSRDALVSHCGGAAPRRNEAPHWCGCGRAFCSERALITHADALGHEVEPPEYADEGDDDGGLDYESLGRLDDAVVKRGLSNAALAALPRSPAAAAFDDPITRERVEKGDAVVALPCGHAFVEGPLRHWFGSSRICPVCRFEVEE